MAVGAKSRGRAYGVMLVLALAAAVVGVMALHKLRERRIFTLLLQDKDRDLISLHLLYQKERESSKEMKRKLEDMKAKVVSLRTQKMELNHRLMDMQGITASLRGTQRTLEFEIEEKQKQIKALTENKIDPAQELSQLAALTEIMKQKDAKIEEMKRQLENPTPVWYIVTDDPPNLSENSTVTENAPGEDNKVEEGKKVGEVSDGELEQPKGSKSGESSGVGGGSEGENVVQDKKQEETSDGSHKNENSKDVKSGEEKLKNPQDGDNEGEISVIGEKHGEFSEDGQLKKPNNSQNSERGDESAGKGKQLREVSEDGEFKNSESLSGGGSLRVEGDKKAEEGKKQEEHSEDGQLGKPGNLEHGEGQTMRGRRRGNHTLRSKKHRKLSKDGYLKIHKISQDGENGMEGKGDGEGSKNGNLKEPVNSRDGEGLTVGGETFGKIAAGENQGKVSEEGELKTIESSQDGVEGLQLGKLENSQDGGWENRGESKGENIEEEKNQRETSRNSQDGDDLQMAGAVKGVEKEAEHEASTVEQSQPENSQGGGSLKTRDESGSRQGEEAAHGIRDPNNSPDGNTGEIVDDGDDIFEEPRTVEGVQDTEDGVEGATEG